MKFANPGLLILEDEIKKTARRYGLNPDDLIVECYIPNNNAIFIETVDGSHFRVHVNLQEDRIIAAEQMGPEDFRPDVMRKYTTYMK